MYADVHKQKREIGTAMQSEIDTGREERNIIHVQWGSMKNWMADLVRECGCAEDSPPTATHINLLVCGPCVRVAWICMALYWVVHNSCRRRAHQR